MTQPSLSFLRPVRDDLRVRVLELLQDGSWHRAKSLCGAISGLTDRGLRQIAEGSRGAVISGQRGYKLTAKATTEEIDHAEAWLLSQAKHMTDRARQIRICRNRKGVAA